MEWEPERTLRGQTFEKQAIELDGTEFIDCRLEECSLTYGGGAPFIFNNTTAIGCRFDLTGAALNTLHALSVMYAHGMAPTVEALFTEIRNPFDDTVQ